MATTAVRTTATGSTKKNRLDTNEQKKLSKAGQFMRDNPNGLFVIVNRAVVNQ